MRRRAFSLVELVIVIVILGIIAAVAIPRITSGSRNAGETALRANLRTIRNAIDFYYLEHKRVWPAARGDGVNADKKQVTLFNQLTKYTNADGVFSDTKDSAFPLGPYIRGTFPKQTVGHMVGQNSAEMKDQDPALVADAGRDFGWRYNVRNGQIIANAVGVGSDGTPYESW